MSTIDTSISGSFSTIMFTSNILTQNDTDSDNQLTIDELEVDEDTFNSIDTDSDGYATKNEILSAINDMLAEYDEMPTIEEFSLILEDLGIDVNLTSSSTSNISTDIISTYDTDSDGSLSSDEISLSDEEFSALDTNEDGVLTADELVEGAEDVLSGDESDEEEDESTTLSSEEIKIYTLQMLFEALDMATDDDDDDDDIALSNLDQFMRLYNEENDETISSYLSNLTDSTSSTISYA